MDRHALRRHRSTLSSCASDRMPAEISRGGSIWPVGGAGRGDRGHRRRLHQLGRVRLRLGEMDRLQRIAFVEASAEVRRGRPVAGFIAELGSIRHWSGAFGERKLGRRRFRARAEADGRSATGGGSGVASMTGGRFGTRRETQPSSSAASAAMPGDGGKVRGSSAGTRSMTVSRVSKFVPWRT